MAQVTAVAGVRSLDQEIPHAPGVAKKNNNNTFRLFVLSPLPPPPSPLPCLLDLISWKLETLQILTSFLWKGSPSFCDFCLSSFIHVTVHFSFLS